MSRGQMVELRRRWASERPGALAMEFEGRQWSWLQLDQEVSRRVAWMQRAGIGPGTRLAVLSSPRPELVLLLHAAAEVGATLLLLHTRWTATEVSAALTRHPVDALVHEVALADRLPHSVRALRIDAPESWVLSPHPERPRGPLTLLFTSGTTGEPKAARLDATHHLASASASALHLGVDAHELHLCSLPLFHVGGLAMVFRALHSGGALLLLPRFDAVAMRDLVVEREVTHLSLVALTLTRLLDQLGGEALLAPPRVVLVGGGPLPAPLEARARAAGLHPLGTWGMTEGASQFATTPPGEIAPHGSAGRALPGVELKVVGPEGELQVRAPQLFDGYEGIPREQTFDAEGWFATGDLGTLDSRGWLTLHARRTDLIKRGGENVYPAEVEAALLACTGVAEVAVVGLEDPVWGQVPIALVVAAPEAFDEAQLRAELTQRLARFKHPARLLRTAALPRTESGKVERKAARALALQLAAAPSVET